MDRPDVKPFELEHAGFVAAAAKGFADSWYALLAGQLADDYNCTLTCDEADAAAGLFRALGRNAQAADILAVHAEHDEEGDLHYAKPKGEFTGGS